MLAVFAFPAFHHCFLKLPNGTSDLKNKINSTQWGHSTHRVFPNLLSQDELIHFFALDGVLLAINEGCGVWGNQHVQAVEYDLYKPEYTLGPSMLFQRVDIHSHQTSKIGRAHV